MSQFISQPAPDVVDNLTTNDGTKALSAAQGKTLNSKLAPVWFSGNEMETRVHLNAAGGGKTYTITTDGLYHFLVETTSGFTTNDEVEIDIGGVALMYLAGANMRQDAFYCVKAGTVVTTRSTNHTDAQIRQVYLTE